MGRNICLLSLNCDTQKETLKILTNVIIGCENSSATDFRHSAHLHSPAFCVSSNKARTKIEYVLMGRIFEIRRCHRMGRVLILIEGGQKGLVDTSLFIILKDCFLGVRGRNKDCMHIST